MKIAAHETAGVYLLPGALRSYLQRFPDIKLGIYRSRLEEIPRQVMDREVDVGWDRDLGGAGLPPRRETTLLEGSAAARRLRRTPRSRHVT